MCFSFYARKCSKDIQYLNMKEMVVLSFHALSTLLFSLFSARELCDDFWLAYCSTHAVHLFSFALFIVHYIIWKNLFHLSTYSFRQKKNPTHHKCFQKLNVNMSFSSLLAEWVNFFLFECLNITLLWCILFLASYLSSGYLPLYMLFMLNITCALLLWIHHHRHMLVYYNIHNTKLCLFFPFPFVFRFFALTFTLHHPLLCVHGIFEKADIFIFQHQLPHSVNCLR